MCAGEGLAVFVDLVEVVECFVERGVGAIVGFLGGQRGDAHAEFDLLAEPAAERVGDLGAQVPFDFVLHETARHRKQGETFDDRQRLHQVEPCALLRCQWRNIRFTVEGGAVCGELAVEFRDDRAPDRRET